MKIPHQFTTLSAKLSTMAVVSVMAVSMGASAATAATVAPASAEVTISAADLPAPVASGYKMTFHDEFDGDQLDTSKWGYQYGCFDPGQRSQATYTDSPDNVSVRDGYLNLTARYSPTKTKWDGTQIPRTCKSGNTTYDAPFTSGMISTKKSDGAVLYSAPASGFYVEARIKLPSALSSWSSFWTTGSKKELGDWPGIGETDIFESKGYDPDYLMSNTHSPQAGNPKKSEQHQGMMHGDTATSQSQFHTYGMLKTSDAIEFYFDGQMTHRVKMSDIKGPNPFVDPDNNYILKLNQMVGGNYLARPKDGNVNDWSDKTYVDATRFADDYKGGANGDDFAGSTMYVDYVRVYEPKTQADEPDQNEPSQPAEPTPAPAPENPVTPAQPEPTPAPEQPAQPENPAPAPAPAPEQPTQPADPAPAQPETSAPAPEQPTQPADPAPAQPETSAPAPEKPTQPADPAPAQPAQTVPAKPTPAPAKPSPAKPTPAPAKPEQNQQAEQAQSDQQQPTQPDQTQKPKPQKPRPDRLANTGMTSWYRPIVVAWNNFCSWITSWWFW